MSDITIEPIERIARIRAMSSDKCRMFIEFRGGLQATADRVDEPFDLSIGDVVAIDGNNEIRLLPNEVWPEESSIGVVKLLFDDEALVEIGGRLKLSQHNAVGCKVGNTIELQESTGIIRVLSEKPVRYLDLLNDEISIEHFRSTPDELDGESFEDFGGMQSVVDRAHELIELSLKQRNLLGKIGARPIKGVLFTGLPGTGKTKLARIIANQSGASFYQINGPAIFSKYYGQSEELLRLLFDDAAKQERAIIFFDEIDSVAGQRSDDAHEASRRVVAQLLTLMDGFQPDTNVVVIAATNRPDDIDVALRRPGRFDWQIDFPLPDKSDREAILRVSARNLATSGEFQYGLLAERTDGWSGAELSAIWSEAALLAVSDKRDTIMQEDVFGGFERVIAARKLATPARRRAS